MINANSRVGTAKGIPGFPGAMENRPVQGAVHQHVKSHFPYAMAIHVGRI